MNFRDRTLGANQVPVRVADSESGSGDRPRNRSSSSLSRSRCRRAHPLPHHAPVRNPTLNMTKPTRITVMAVFQGGRSENGTLDIRPPASLPRDLPEVKVKIDRTRSPGTQGFMT